MRVHCLLLIVALAGVGRTGRADAVWTLALGGDVMLNGVAVSARPFSGVADVLRDADLCIVNLEVPFASAGTPTKRKSVRDIARRAQFVLRADPAHVVGLTEAGIDAVTLGNNHAMDYGPKGLLETLGVLERAGIARCGAGSGFVEAWKAVRLDREGLPRVALISALAFRTSSGLGACTPATASSAGVAALDLGGRLDRKGIDRIQRLVAKHRGGADLFVVALHWGNERETLPTAYQVALGRAFVDAGADLVVGHHPHVLQGAEMYKGKPILYSLGNLVSGRPSTSAIVRVRFEGERVLGLEVLPIRIWGGRATLLLGKAAKAKYEAFRALCSKLRRAYPSQQAAFPKLALADESSASTASSPPLKR